MYIYICPYRYTPTTCANPACVDDPVLCPNSVICAPLPLPRYSYINNICVIIYAVDFFVRCAIAWAVPVR